MPALLVGGSHSLATDSDITPREPLKRHSVEANGFLYPDWDQVADWVEANIDEAGLDDFWLTLASAWIDGLRENLGGDYQKWESENFILVSPGDERSSRALLEFAEDKLERLLDTLGGLANDEGFGKHLVLYFDSPETYWNYISYFYPDGTFSTIVGVSLSPGYQHIALTPQDRNETEATLLHELFHNCVYHLDLPTWLNEGLAQLTEVACGMRRSLFVDVELKERHLELWTDELIQDFWSGELWDGDPEEVRASYELAELLLTLILTNTSYRRETFEKFVTEASWEDAGESAAREWLGRSIGEFLNGFLGPGDWAPRLPRN